LAEQVGAGGAGGAQHQPAELFVLVVHGVAQVGQPEGGGLGVDGGSEVGAGAGAASSSDAGVDAVPRRAARVRVGVGGDQRVGQQRGQQRVRVGGSPGPAQPPPQVGPVGLDDRADAVVFF
jgi:hypothetical protein